MKFSKYLNIIKHQRELDFLDIDLSKDTPVFIDPWLIEHQAQKGDEFAYLCSVSLQTYFQVLINFIAENNKKGAIKLLDFLHEPIETRIGYSSKGSSGLAIGRGNSEQIYDLFSNSNAVKTKALKDLEDTALFIEGIDIDKISDLVTNIIRGDLIKYTNNQVKLLSIEDKVKKFSDIPVWDRKTCSWARISAELPCDSKDRPIILIPKVFLTKKLTINARDFYQHAVLPFYQNQYVRSGNKLCRLLKNGDIRPPSKKALEKEISFSKEDIFNFAQKNQNILKEYKENRNPKINRVTGKKTKISNINKLIGSTSPQRDLKREMAQIKSGKKDAGKYESLLSGILVDIFDGQLRDPKIQDPIDEGRRRVDLTMINFADSGFFIDCAKLGIACRIIYFEFKNYSEDLKNAEIDQLLGRFGINSTKIGFIICRSIENRKLLIERLNDYVRKQNNYIICLTDEDIFTLYNMKQVNDLDGIRIYLNKLLDEINPR